MQNDKREGYFDWDETFMQMSKVIAERSKDPNTQNGACIVNADNVVVGLGYNGFPRGCGDAELPWSREGDFCDKKYAYVVHAEENAIYNANASTEGARLYCTLFPCNECTKAIIQNGIKEVIFEDDKYHDDDIWKASRKMLDLAGVTYRQYLTKNNLIFEKK
jgi:dCMP deaminase